MSKFLQDDTDPDDGDNRAMIILSSKNRRAKYEIIIPLLFSLQPNVTHPPLISVCPHGPVSGHSMTLGNQGTRSF